MAISISDPKTLRPAQAGGVSNSPEGMVDARCSRLDEIAAAARGIMRSSIRDLGALLREAKGLLPHGKFEGWARRELGVSLRSAENYMAASRFLEGKSETVAHLPPNIIYKLASPSAPPELVADVAGGGLDLLEIKKQLRAADHARREAEWHARLAQKQPRRRVAHLHPPAPEPAVAHAASSPPADLARLAARLFDSGLARDVLEILSNAERRTALAGLLAERDR